MTVEIEVENAQQAVRKQ